jgi:beta-lactam-binding protein with PASTA domain
MDHRLGPLVDYMKNRYLWYGLTALMVVGLAGLLLFNEVLMPSYTRYDVAVTVPDVTSFTLEEGLARLQEEGLSTETVELRKPNVPKDVIIDQAPGPGSRVKPGRRIWVTVNSGDTTTVIVPNLESLPIREAQNHLIINDLIVADVLPDSIPSAHANTITRQEPEAGSQVPPRTPVTLWYSTGLGDTFVEVPDVVGMDASEARRFLLERNLRSIVLGSMTGPTESFRLPVTGQSPAAGTSVREGHEVRLRTERVQSP